MDDEISILKEELINESSMFFNSLNKDEQLLVFCEVIRRIYEAEFQEGKTYRGILYDTFEFKEDAYLKAQAIGFLEIHNKLNICRKNKLNEK